MTLPVWLFAQDLSSTRSFVIRTETPRLIAELIEEEDFAALESLVYATQDGQALVLHWIDPPPGREETLRLLANAIQFVRDYDGSTDLMTEDGPAD